MKTRLVQRAGVESRHVTGLHRLIGVVQTRAAADCVQSAHVARIDGIDVVETVTSAELIVRIDAVIDPAEEVGGVKTRRHHATANQLTAIVSGAQTIIDRVDQRWVDSNDCRIVSTRLFEVSEEERPVVPNRSAHRAAILRLR